MYKVIMLFIIAFGISAAVWGICDLAATSGEAVTSYLGLAKIGLGFVLATMVLGFSGVFEAIDDRNVRLPKGVPLRPPSWLTTPKK